MDNPKELYQDRLTRVLDAVALRQPDRVPLIPQIEAFPMEYSGISMKDAMYDARKAAAAFDIFYRDFQQLDLGWGPVTIHNAPVLEACGLEWFHWPGRHISDPKQMYQYVEGEYMLAEEYDELIHDPTHFIQSKWIPRCFTKLAGLRNIRLRDSIFTGFLGSFAAFADPEVVSSLKNLSDTAQRLMEWFEVLGEYEKKMEVDWGYPIAVGSHSIAPFDLLGDTLRGTYGILQDILDRPEKVLAAVEALYPVALEWGVDGCRASGRRFVWIWLHKGLDQFMSTEQYALLYWPTLRRLIHDLVREDLIPIVYCEGSYNTRLELLRDVPAGKVVYDFETVDMYRAKDILGDVACIAGNVPNAMLVAGGADEVDVYCRDLIETVGRNGGFMLDAGGLIDNAKPENLRSMFDSVAKYAR